MHSSYAVTRCGGRSRADFARRRGNVVGYGTRSLPATIRTWPALMKCRSRFDKREQMNTQKIIPARAFYKPILLAIIPCAAALMARACRAAEIEDPRRWVAENMPALVELYHHLHQTPELSSKEKETSARMAKELRDIGATVTTNVGGYGVVGVLANGTGKVLLFRSDMDALPVAERTGLPYASKVRTQDSRGATVGVMHACGHDLHMTNLIGVARCLAANRDGWSGTIVFVFQPAEETGAGADAMIQDGLFKRFPRPDFAVALHDSADVPTGKVTYRPGFGMANIDSVDIVVKGRGGHGASPEATIDPIVTAARLVLDLQTIVSREVKPIEPAVVTVGSIHGGTKHNVISDECRLQLTLRSLSPQVRQQLRDAVRRKALAAAASAARRSQPSKYPRALPHCSTIRT